jgi:hypothetical protein
MEPPALAASGENAIGYLDGRLFIEKDKVAAKRRPCLYFTD